MAMASSQGDHNDDNEHLGVSDLKAAFEDFIVQATPKTHQPISRKNSVTFSTLKVANFHCWDFVPTSLTIGQSHLGQSYTRCI